MEEGDEDTPALLQLLPIQPQTPVHGRMIRGSFYNDEEQQEANNRCYDNTIDKHAGYYGNSMDNNGYHHGNSVSSRRTYTLDLLDGQESLSDIRLPDIKLPDMGPDINVVEY